MKPDQLIQLAKDKNKAHRTLLEARARVRMPAGAGRTEKDRDIDMDFRTLDQREVYENLADEYAVRVMEYQVQPMGSTTK